MSRRWIGAIAFCVLTSSASSSRAKDNEGPPVPQEANGAWSNSIGSVDTNSGTAVATYPFALPPARGAIQPSLGLVYRHTAGPSEVGEGWSLGLPEIVRRGVAGGPPLFDNTDHFELSGQQLVECTGACDQDPRPTWAGPGWSHYRGRAERSPVHVYRKADGGLTWRLQLAQGGFAELGYPEVGSLLDTSLSIFDRGGIDVVGRAFPSANVYRWKLVRMVEAAPGNAWRNVVALRWVHASLILYPLFEDTLTPAPGVSVLTDIFYTPHPGHPLNAFDQYAHHVKLEYEFWRTTLDTASPPIWRGSPDPSPHNCV